MSEWLPCRVNEWFDRFWCTSELEGLAMPAPVVRNAGHVANTEHVARQQTGFGNCRERMSFAVQKPKLQQNLCSR